MKTLQALQRLQEETKAEVFLVGGFVRDYLRNKKNDDLDIVVRKVSSNAIIAYLKKHGSCKRVTLAINNDAFTTELILFRGKDDVLIAQIVLPRRGKRQIADKNNTLRQDAKYRDFKINAMYLPSGDHAICEGSLISRNFNWLTCSILSSELANPDNGSTARVGGRVIIAAIKPSTIPISFIVICFPTLSHRYTPDKLSRACIAFSGLYPVISASALRLCGGRDSNPRIPTKIGPEPIAFDLAGQPPHRGLFFSCA